MLCGGEGKRLRPITYYIQKTMIPIGYEQKPLLEYVVRLLRFHGLKDIALLVNFKAEQIQNFFGDGSRFNVNLSYTHDTESMKGTGGSVINAYRHGVFDEQDTILVYYGDIITNMNLRDVMNFHKQREAAATVALASGFEVRVGVADLGKNREILGFIEKPKLEKPVSIGILAFEGQAVKDSQKLFEQKSAVDLMGDIIPHLIEAGQIVSGFLSDAFWYDLGSIEAFEKLDERKVKDSMSFLL